MNSADSFSATYAEARAKFRATAQEAGGALDSVANPNRAPDGGDLSTDIAWFGSRDAEKVLVMVSGTHGAEGFCGSGAQVDWLRRGEHTTLPADIGVLMIHAINPYGFAWLRRVTEENIDLRFVKDAVLDRISKLNLEPLNEAIAETAAVLKANARDSVISFGPALPRRNAE